MCREKIASGTFGGKWEGGQSIHWGTPPLSQCSYVPANVTVSFLDFYIFVISWHHFLQFWVWVLLRFELHVVQTSFFRCLLCVVNCKLLEMFV